MVVLPPMREYERVLLLLDSRLAAVGKGEDRLPLLLMEVRLVWRPREGSESESRWEGML